MKNDFIKEELNSLKERGLYRTLRSIESAQGPEVVINGKKYLCFCSNNYLGLADNPDIKKTVIDALEKYGLGAGASRLISGSMCLHEQLEKTLARFKKKEAALVFPTGYMANLGIISALVGKEDIVIVDKLNHASIIDACKLSGALIRIYPHKDMVKLEKILNNAGKYSRRLIVTDSLFSMDGDIAPLEDIVELAKKYDAITMIDEAHATGVFGKSGGGVAQFLGVEEEIDITMGTLSKALGCMGGFVAGSEELIAYLKNKARSFIYTTALPPMVCAGALAALEYMQNNPELRESLWKNVAYLQGRLEENGWLLNSKESQILPVIIGEIEETMKISTSLLNEGILVPGIRPPTVPKGTSRLRISVMATHTRKHLDRLVEIIKTPGIAAEG